MWIRFQPRNRVSLLILKINVKFWKETRFLKPPQSPPLFPPQWGGPRGGGDLGFQGYVFYIYPGAGE